VVKSVVVIVAVALAGGVTVAGLTVQAGVEVKFDGDTEQPKVTVPLKPLMTPTVMFEDDVPPGATASGENAAASKVKFCAVAPDPKLSIAARRHKAGMPARPARIFCLDCDGLDCDDSDFNMSRFK
jgi:hypothetical protein